MATSIDTRNCAQVESEGLFVHTPSNPCLALTSSRQKDAARASSEPRDVLFFIQMFHPALVSGHEIKNSRKSATKHRSGASTTTPASSLTVSMFANDLFNVLYSGSIFRARLGPREHRESRARSAGYRMQTGISYPTADRIATFTIFVQLGKPENNPSRENISTLHLLVQLPITYLDSVLHKIPMRVKIPDYLPAPLLPRTLNRQLESSSTPCPQGSADRRDMRRFHPER